MSPHSAMIIAERLYTQVCFIQWIFPLKQKIFNAFDNYRVIYLILEPKQLIIPKILILWGC